MANSDGIVIGVLFAKLLQKRVPVPRDNHEIVRSDNPKCKELENAGYNLIATSWGAHLDIESNFDIENLKRRIENCKSNGHRLEMLGAGHFLWLKSGIPI